MQKLTFSKVFHTGNILKFNLDQELYSKHWWPDLLCWNLGSASDTATTTAPDPGYKSWYLALGHPGGLLPWDSCDTRPWSYALDLSCLCSDLGMDAPVQQLFLQLHASSSSVVWISWTALVWVAFQLPNGIAIESHLWYKFAFYFLRHESKRIGSIPSSSGTFFFWNALLP